MKIFRSTSLFLKTEGLSTLPLPVRIWLKGVVSCYFFLSPVAGILMTRPERKHETAPLWYCT